MELTKITEQGLKAGLGFAVFGATICPKCKLTFLDGIEGGSENKFCDECEGEGETKWTLKR
jgi:hypothetical protein